MFKILLILVIVFSVFKQANASEIINSNVIVIGRNQASDKTIKFLNSISTNTGLKWDDTARKMKFSNAGSFLNIASESDPRFLPTSCSSSQVVKYKSGGWVCSTDNTNSGSSVSLRDGSVTTSKLAADSVTSSKIADNSVGASHLQSQSVSETKLSTNSVTSSKLASSSVGNSELQNGSVSLNKLTTSLSTLISNAGGQAEARSSNLKSHSQTISGTSTTGTLIREISVSTSNRVPIIMGFSITAGRSNSDLEFAWFKIVLNGTTIHTFHGGTDSEVRRVLFSGTALGNTRVGTNAIQLRAYTSDGSYFIYGYNLWTYAFD